jgi:hypothetical protein
MLGIKINDSQTVLKKIKLKVLAKEDGAIKYLTKNGNEFSITMENGKVVYLEEDWSHKLTSSQSSFPNLIFGKTSLNKIRSIFGSNGFFYNNQYGNKTGTELMMFNCFEFNSSNNEVLVIITKIALKNKATEDNIGDKLKLDAIIIADKNYLDEIWGNDKEFEPDYKKINIQSLQH